MSGATEYRVYSELGPVELCNINRHGGFMRVSEALTMLEKAPHGDKPAAVNKALTQQQAVEIVRKGLLSKHPDEELSHLYEKRVWQVCRNQRRPRIQPRYGW